MGAACRCRQFHIACDLTRLQANDTLLALLCNPSQAGSRSINTKDNMFSLFPLSISHVLVCNTCLILAFTVVDDIVCHLILVTVDDIMCKVPLCRLSLPFDWGWLSCRA